MSSLGEFLWLRTIDLMRDFSAKFPELINDEDVVKISSLNRVLLNSEILKLLNFYSNDYENKDLRPSLISNMVTKLILSHKPGLAKNFQETVNKLNNFFESEESQPFYGKIDGLFQVHTYLNT